MHKARTPWPIQARAAYIASFEHLRRQHPRLSALAFCRAAGVSYSTFSRWWAAWERRDRKKALADRSRRPHRSPTTLSGRVPPIIRSASPRIGFRSQKAPRPIRPRLGPICCSLSSVYRALRRCACALVRCPRKPKRLWLHYA